MAVHDIPVRASGDRRESAPPGAAPPAAPGRKRRRDLRSLEPLLWLGPAVALILTMVVWPVVEMARTSLTRISSTGLSLGPAGLDNYADLFAEEDLPGVLLRTLVWVVGVVTVTLLLSLGLAQLLNTRFPGQRAVRWALIVPWAASVLMTALIWRWMLNNFYGVVNRVLMDMGLLDKPVNWLADPVLGFAAMMAVAVFVSLPFTAFVILAGLQTIPAEVYEAARMDGAGPARTYLSVTLPLLRPSLLVAAIINIINVFNSFPIIWAMTRGGPGFATDTTTTFMYKLAFDNQAVGESAAMAVVNFALILVVVLAYLRVVRWREEIR
ncbi:carbohydrate ABC transporter permease [Streptomyces stelliscabiei]|uniref:ABC-type sugar transport system permease subunit n=1 Tax=Streptomyces stelliscabiei TaxID=146820 RepID=A0A8I0TM70_9ACTN|nr:sugar ABC transporter permease [Streptomyces stelliscabiei]KND26311.1 ABC transporter permease [Streptomyces stelliscabiei]MBE1594245.1 ABC-type sugar transport system permease subunit [Streptomyces stelliscabiei]